MKAWDGRFSKETSKEIEDFTASIKYDVRLFNEDIDGSIAHVRMLSKCGILPHDEAERIVAALEEIRNEIASGKVRFGTEFEDIHMAIEKMLIDKLGALGGKLHTARSRNDQVALDMHLYVKKQAKELISLISEFQSALVRRAEELLDAIMPGYTHLQHAQPIRLSHHIMGYFYMFERDIGRLEGVLERADSMPLGAGALAGSPYNIDPAYVSEQLGFAKLYSNSLDAVSDRDFVIELASAAAILMMHLSRLAEEVIIWSSQEFGFVELDDAHSTGSSIMPQKKNPDVAELVRAKTGRVYGHLISLLVIMKALPLAYNRDMQEDKEAIFDAVDTAISCLKVMKSVVETLQFKVKRMQEALDLGYSTATQLADYLTLKGMPFREAHKLTGAIVKECLKEGIKLTELTVDKLREFSQLFDNDVVSWLTPEASVEARRSPGGTALENVKAQIREARGKLSARNLEVL